MGGLKFSSASVAHASEVEPQTGNSYFPRPRWGQPSYLYTACQLTQAVVNSRTICGAMLASNSFGCEINSKDDDATSGLCRVCGDHASGNHFGVLSCEACRSFFRRSVRVSSQYACRGARNCPVMAKTRNRCPFCRLQKCLAVGMRRQGESVWV